MSEQGLSKTDISSIGVALERAGRARAGLLLFAGFQLLASIPAIAGDLEPAWLAMINGVALLPALVAALFGLLGDRYALAKLGAGWRRVLAACVAACGLSLLLVLGQGVRLVWGAAKLGGTSSGLLSAAVIIPAVATLFAGYLAYLLLHMGHIAVRLLTGENAPADRALLEALARPRSGRDPLKTRNRLTSFLLWIPASLAFLAFLLVNSSLKQLLETGDGLSIVARLASFARMIVEAVLRGDVAALIAAAVLCAYLLAGAVLLTLRTLASFSPSSPLNRLRRWSKDAGSALQRDERRPVLLLRSFADETVKGVLWQGARSMETVVGPVASRRGPFIAIGIPGELAPSGEAYRSYLSDAEWQAAVLAWMEQSQRIVVILGRTPWVRWELDQIVARGHIEKTIVMPTAASREDLEARWAILSASLAGTPWSTGLAAVREIAEVRTLHFASGGRVCCTSSAATAPYAYEIAVQLAFNGSDRG